MKKDDQEVLKEVQKNARMGVKAINTISEKVCDDILRHELSKEKRKYTDLYHRAEDSLANENAEGYHASAMEDMMLKGAIHMNTMMNCSNSKIAELMIQGSNRGLTDMWKSVNHHEGATNTSMEIAKELMDFEEKCVEQLKRYL